MLKVRLSVLKLHLRLSPVLQDTGERKVPVLLVVMKCLILIKVRNQKLNIKIKLGPKRKEGVLPKRELRRIKPQKEEKKKENSPPVSNSPDLENDSVSVAEGETSGRTKRPTSGKCPKQFNSALVANFWIEGGDDSDEDYVPSE